MMGNPNRRVASALCLLASLLSQDALAALRDGAWSAEGVSWSLRQRNYQGKSALLRATENLPRHATITMVYWRTAVVAPYPSGLKQALCTAERCIELPGGLGGSSAFAGDRANADFYFSLFLPGKGAIKSPVQMLQSQVIVNYRYAETD